jgi:4-hydroxy-tetrahydrodipicolinate synthase
VAAETAVEHVAGRVPVVVHVGAATTREAVGLARHARDIGATAVAAAAPYFYALGNAALCDYFRHISASVADLPFYLYNIPQRTGNAITPALAREVASSCDNVVGIKDSSGDLTRTLEMRGIRPGGFQVAMGSDALLLPALSMGVEAAVAGNANVFPEVAVDVFESWWRGDVAAAQRAQDRFSAIRRALKEGSDLSLLKSALAHRGVPVGTVRPPLRAAPEAEVQLALSALFE